MELIVSVNNKNVIGNNGQLLWHIPEDIKHFYKITKYQIVVMGRKTYESLPDKCRPLKNRINIVLTNNKSLYKDSVKDHLYFVDTYTIDHLIKHLKSICNKRIVIIGGKNLYERYIDRCNVLHITHINDDTEGDTKLNIDKSRFICISTVDRYCETNKLYYKINKYISKLII